MAKYNKPEEKALNDQKWWKMHDRSGVGITALSQEIHIILLSVISEKIKT